MVTLSGYPLLQIINRCKASEAGVQGLVPNKRLCALLSGTSEWQRCMAAWLHGPPPCIATNEKASCSACKCLGLLPLALSLLARTQRFEGVTHWQFPSASFISAVPDALTRPGCHMYRCALCNHAACYPVSHWWPIPPYHHNDSGSQELSMMVTGMELNMHQCEPCQAAAGRAQAPSAAITTRTSLAATALASSLAYCATRIFLKSKCHRKQLTHRPDAGRVPERFACARRVQGSNRPDKTHRQTGDPRSYSIVCQAPCALRADPAITATCSNPSPS